MSAAPEPAARSSAQLPETPARWRVAAAAFASCVLLVATAFGLCRDMLFFSSPWPLAVYLVVATGALLALAVAPLWLLARLLPRALRRRLALAVVVSTPALLLAGFLIFAVESVREFSSLGGMFQAWLASLTAAFILLLKGPGSREARVRASALTLGLAGLSAAIVAAGLLASHGSARGRDRQPGRHVVLVVIDGMPSQLLSSYQPQAPPTTFDAIAGRGRTFTAGRTNFTYTDGFFFALYRADLAGAEGAGGRHLLSELERAGVTTRWLTYHTNGVPEAREIRDYGGFRSTILTEQLAWWPRLLGINYHTFLQARRQAYQLHPRINAMYEVVHGGRTFDQEGFFERFLPGQVRELQDRFRSSFLLAHVPVSAGATVQALEAGLFTEEKERFGELFGKVKLAEYRYDPRWQDLVDAYRDHVRSSINVWAPASPGCSTPSRPRADSRTRW